MPYARIGRQTFWKQLVVSFASKNVFGSSHVLCLQPSAYEEVDWCLECTTEIPDAQELKEWMTVGKVMF